MLDSWTKEKKKNKNIFETEINFMIFICFVWDEQQNKKKRLIDG